MNPAPESVVWLVRHAEVTTPTLFHGAESDVDLGEHGLKQAAASARWFAERKPTAVVSSAMRRAVQTAAPIAAACRVPNLVEPLLHERFVGSLSGRPRAEGDPIWEETLSHWLAGRIEYARPGMESFAAVRDRVLPVFRRVAEAHRGGRVVVVAHGVVCKVLLLSLLRDHSAADWVRIGVAKNLAVSELIADGEFWAARELLLIPPPVVEVNAALLDTGAKKTEA
jgi:broad specificity phosphatase PhoE